MARVLLSAAVLAAVGCAAPPERCPFVRGARFGCPICPTHDDLARQGEVLAMPSFRRPPRDDVPRWSGATLPAEMPDPRLYVRCRPCTCAPSGRIEPWREWEEINRRAYRRLRTARAVYPVAIVPGFHGGGPILSFRLRHALALLRQGWVAAVIVSGGHRRAGANEARTALNLAWESTADESDPDERLDLTDRIFVEPCACRTLTNLRNSLRMMEAFNLPAGLLVTDMKMSGQAAVFSSDLDALVERDLRCAVGRVSHLRGATPLTRLSAPTNGCRAPFNFRNNPIMFLLPRREAVVFWVSPRVPMPGRTARTALDCGPGAEALRDCEPENRDPFGETCLPVLERDDLGCAP